ncbi:MAG: hypothetical protein CVV27_12165 [Candidatus Melainabacteria bacterium HGW-Melainabacteria-1]|nr:MAG: hypothetical protein CVV27_12165 [Candidatus Melainabacteria bacterium HGW-Melainabacteria-1]
MTISVLVISPSFSTREMLARYLSSELFTVYTASHAQMAMPMIETLPLQGVIYELNLEQASGLDLLLWLNHHYQHLHNILICDTEDTDLLEILATQKVAVIPKDGLHLPSFRNRLQIMLQHARGNTWQFHQINLFELVHLASHSNQSRHLYIASPQTAQEGLVYFNQGRVQHALYDTFSGEEAFYEIIQMKQGLFQETEFEPNSVYTIASGLNELMALSALKIDQQGGVKMPMTYCTVLSCDMSLGDYLSTAYPDAEMEVFYSDEISEVLQQLKSRADLLIVDLDMPDFDAQAFFEQLQSASLKIVTLLISSRIHPDIPHLLRLPQVNRFFLKVEQYKELGDLIHHNYLSQQFSGNLLNMPLLDVLQTLIYFRQPRLIEVTDFFSGKSGQIFLADGGIQHAVFDHWSGRDALKEMLAIQAGLFRQETYFAPAAHTLDVPVTRLFLYLSRIIDKLSGKLDLPRELLLQDGALITLQPEKISYLLAISKSKVTS